MTRARRAFSSRMRWLVLLCLTSVALAAPPCVGDSLARIAKAEWGVDVVLAFTCRPIRGKRAVRLVEAHVAEDPTPGWVAIVDREDGVLWSRQTYSGMPGQALAFTLVDLDGDGAEEVIAHEIYESHRGGGSAALHVYAVRAEGIDDAGTLSLGENGGRSTGANGCSGRWALVGGRGKRPRVQITATRETDPRFSPAPDTCPLDGVHRYRWTGEAFALAD